MESVLKKKDRPSNIILFWIMHPSAKLGALFKREKSSNFFQLRLIIRWLSRLQWVYCLMSWLSILKPDNRVWLGGHNTNGYWYFMVVKAFLRVGFIWHLSYFFSFVQIYTKIIPYSIIPNKIFSPRYMRKIEICY